MWRDEQLRRLWKKVNKTEGCWLWTGALARGYGVVRIEKNYHRVHRVVWEWSNQTTVPDGLFVLHRCDVKACVRPNHLWVGTQAENMADMIRKGRHPFAHGQVGNPLGLHVPARGAAARKSALTDELVLEIRARYAAGETQTSLASKYGIDQTTVSNITRRMTWTHI